MGVAPKSREGTARRLLGFPRRLWGTSPRSGTKRRGAAGRNRDPLPNLRPARPSASLASPRFLPPAASFPHLASAPLLLKSPRDPARAAEAAAGTRAPRRVLGQSARSPRRRRAREPKPGRLLPWRAEPDRAEPSRAEPGAQSAGGGGAEPR